jgi:hypothetical protein
MQRDHCQVAARWSLHGRGIRGSVVSSCRSKLSLQPRSRERGGDHYGGAPGEGILFGSTNVFRYRSLQPRIAEPARIRIWAGYLCRLLRGTGLGRSGIAGFRSSRI